MAESDFRDPFTPDPLAGCLSVVAYVLLGLLAAALLAAFVGPLPAAAPQDVTRAKAQAALAISATRAKPPQAILCDCSCWVCICSTGRTCGEAKCRHPRPAPAKAEPSTCKDCPQSGCNCCQGEKGCCCQPPVPAKKAPAFCERCQKKDCKCGCTSDEDCKCPAEPKDGEVRPAKDGGPSWTYDAKKEIWWRRVPAAPTPARQIPLAQPAFQTAPLYLPPPLMFRPPMPMGPPPMMGGFGGGMRGGCRGGG